MVLIGGLQALVSTLNAATDVFQVELKADAGASVVAQGSAGMVMLEVVLSLVTTFVDFSALEV